MTEYDLIADVAIQSDKVLSPSGRLIGNVISCNKIMGTVYAVLALEENNIQRVEEFKLPEGRAVKV